MCCLFDSKYTRQKTSVSANLSWSQNFISTHWKKVIYRSTLFIIVHNIALYPDHTSNYVPESRALCVCVCGYWWWTIKWIFLESHHCKHLLHADSILSTIPKGRMTIFSVLYLLSIIHGDTKKKKNKTSNPQENSLTSCAENVRWPSLIGQAVSWGSGGAGTFHLLSSPIQRSEYS